MKWLVRVLAVCWGLFFVSMQVWAVDLWMSEGPPPPMAYFAEIVMTAVTIYLGWLLLIAESE